MAHPDHRDPERRRRAIVLVGPPGSGKGTLGKILGEIPGFFFVSMGDVLREVAPGSERYEQIEHSLQRGELVPAEVVLLAWRDYLDCHRGSDPDADSGTLVLDGLPRDVEQAKLLRSYVSVERVIHLACEDEAVLIDRIQQRSQQKNRSDDRDPEVVRHRIAVYHQQTEPLFEFYPQEIVAEVAAERTPLEVLAQSVEVLLADREAAGGRQRSRPSGDHDQGDPKDG